jgi:type I restriction enzyme M protein
MRAFILSHFKICSLVELGDQTFSGTTTSPIILFLQKKEKIDLNYKTLLINSPKMLFESSKKEKEFLGYEFSKNKYKLGINILNDDLAKNYSPLVKQFILGNNVLKNSDKYVKIKNIQDILLRDNSSDDVLIYSRMNLHKGNK